MNKCLRKCLIKNGFWVLVAAGLVGIIAGLANPIAGLVIGGIFLTGGMAAAIQDCKKQCGIG